MRHGYVAADASWQSEEGCWAHFPGGGGSGGTAGKGVNVVGDEGGDVEMS